MARRPLAVGPDNLTDRERIMLNYMKDVAREKGYPPTVREICIELNIKSTSTCHKDLERLAAKGFIRKDPAKPRAIEIVDFDRYKGRDGINSVAHTGSVDIPVIGSIAAGLPIFADQNISETLPIPSNFINTGADHFLLVVKGESMIEAGILDGDYILVKAQNTAHNGDMVVAMIDGFESEATVKTFYREDDHVRLQPENSSMSPIIVKDVKILGIVKGVLRYFN